MLVDKNTIHNIVKWRGMRSGVSEVAIIGAGPAGCATAIQLKRSGIDPTVFERSKVGGLLLNANMVENYPGFPQGITGVRLAGLFEKHLARLKIEVENANVLELHYEDGATQSGGVFLIETGEDSFRTRMVVVASGTHPKELRGLEIPEEAKNRVIYEIYPILGDCGKRVAIVGSGDCALDYALNLARRSNHVVILNRSTRRKCLPVLWRDVREEKRIVYEENIEIRRISRTERGLLLECAKESDSHFEISIDYLIVAIGRIPQIDYISQTTRKSIPALQRHGRLYFVGDVKRGDYRQSAIAVGDGIHAAMKIHRRLRKEKE